MSLEPVESSGPRRMRKAKGSFRLVRPKCPMCASDHVQIVRSAGNWGRIGVDLIISIFLWPIFSYKWKCLDCGCEFKVEKVTER